MPHNKKTEEKRILEKFLAVACPSAEILTADEARRYFRNYNDENPDFIIKIEVNFIGIELFELSRSSSPQLAGYNTISGRPAKNLRHFIAGEKNYYDSLDELQADLKQHGRRLKRQDDIEQILIERIKDKMTKLPYYVTERIWFLGYANQISIHTKLVQNIFEDNIIKPLRQSILRFVTDKRIEKIYLFETGASSKDFIIDLI